MKLDELDEFTKAYIEAALWSSTDETNPEQGGEPLDANYDAEDIETETLAEMLADCVKFQANHADLINNDNVATKPDNPMFDGVSCDARAGHDFWLTREGHGAGFWDGDWAEPAATTLTEVAKSFGEFPITASGKGGKVEKM